MTLRHFRTAAEFDAWHAQLIRDEIAEREPEPEIEEPYYPEHEHEFGCPADPNGRCLNSPPHDTRSCMGCHRYPEENDTCGST